MNDLPKRKLDVYGDASTGLAVLRRDGFASMDGPATSIPASEPNKNIGMLTTRPVRFSGRYLFVNANMTYGELRAEILDANGRIIEPFSFANCVPLKADATKQQIVWHQEKDLRALAGKPVQFRFQLTGGQLYSFWVSPELSGASHGYVGAAGPGFTGSTDTTGA